MNGRLSIMPETEAKMEWKWRRECPRFNGIQAEYKGWKGQVEDWLAVCGDSVIYPGIEIRLSLKGRALEVTEGVDTEELKKTDGERKILKFWKFWILSKMEKILLILEILDTPED